MSNFCSRLVAGILVAQPILFHAPGVLAQTAQTYPSGPVKLVTPTASGGVTDLLARVTAGELSKRLGVAVSVENRPGGSSSNKIGMAAVIAAPPDGYTLLFGTSDGFVYPTITPSPYDTDRDLRPIIKHIRVEAILAGQPNLKAASIKELVALAKANPGKLSIASNGIGSSTHLSGEMFKLATGTNMLHVPYKASAQAFTDMIGGRLDLVVTGFAPIAPHVKSGVKVLASFGAKRNPAWVDVPTMRELGYPDLVVETWQGILAPAATPEPIVLRLARDLDAIARSKNFEEQMLKFGSVPDVEVLAEFAKAIKDERARWARVVKDANIQLIE